MKSEGESPEPPAIKLLRKHGTSLLKSLAIGIGGALVLILRESLSVDQLLTGLLGTLALGIVAVWNYEARMRRLKATIAKLENDANSSEDLIAVEDIEISDLDQKILTFLSSNDGATSEEVGQHIGASKDRAEVYLMALDSVKLIYAQGYINGPHQWELIPRGREYLVHHNLIH